MLPIMGLRSSTENIIGKTVAEATSMLASVGMKLRILSEDGMNLLGSTDYDKARCNVAVKKGVVTEVLRFG